MKVLTPYAVASRFNIRLSLAKAFLKELENRKMVEYVSGGKNLKIYKMLA
jgi:ribosomal protein S25